MVRLCHVFVLCCRYRASVLPERRSRVGVDPNVRGFRLVVPAASHWRYFLAQFINGLVLPVLLVFMALISSDKRVMGKFKSGRVTKVLIWVTVGIVSVLTAILLVMQVFGIG